MKSIFLSMALMLPVFLPSTMVPVHQQPEISFPVISDVHVQLWDLRAQHKFKQALDDLHDLDPEADALVVNGDLGNGNAVDYGAVRTLLSRHPHPRNTFYTIGNHEFYKAWHNEFGVFSEKTFPNGESDQASVARFLAFTGQPKVYQDRWINGYHFLFLGSEKYRQSEWSILEDAYLSPEQLAWLKEKLAEKKQANKPMFVFLHQPLHDVVQEKELREILAAHPEVILFSGHTHQSLRKPHPVVREPFSQVNSSSVYAPHLHGGPPLSEDASEGLMVSVYPDQVVIRGRDFTKHEWIEEAQIVVPIPSPTDTSL